MISDRRRQGVASNRLTRRKQGYQPARRKSNAAPRKRRSGKGVRQRHDIARWVKVDRETAWVQQRAAGLNIYTLMPMRRFEHQRRASVGVTIPRCILRKNKFPSICAFATPTTLFDDVSLSLSLSLILVCGSVEGFENRGGAQHGAKNWRFRASQRAREHKLCALSKH